jgi:tetratricopeptide (TPR) repeat protein
MDTRTMQRFSTRVAVLFTVLMCAVGHAMAQSAIMNLPRVSQHARVTQRIGITDITIDYHRPLVGARRIFGGLEAYGQVWRAGANENVTIEFTDAVTVEGRPLPKGIYGLHMIPGETSWVIIFSRNSTSWGSFSYQPAEDALRVTVTPATTEAQEALTYQFDAPTPTSSMITMRWERISVPFTVEVDTPHIVESSLQTQLRGRAQFEWQPWVEAANYLLMNNLSAEEAEEDAARSIEIEDRFENEITKARALSALGRTAAARAARAQAVAIGRQAQIHDFARGLQAQGLQAEAIELFRINITKAPNTWITHNELARIAVASSDFATAIKEMRLAVTTAPDALKAQHSDLVRRLQNGDDINK